MSDSYKVLSEYDLPYLQHVMQASGMPLNDAQSRQLEEYVRMLLDWNTRINLISRTDEEGVWRNHILHSLAIHAVRPLPETGRYIDIGTGGGLPGIPLAILLPKAKFILCDSIGKKIRAVEEMVGLLSLKNVECIHARVEDITRKRGTFTAILARAVTSLDDLTAWSRFLYSFDGLRCLLAWKGGDLKQEILQARRQRGVQRIVVHEIVLGGEDYFLREEKKIVEVQFRR